MNNYYEVKIGYNGAGGAGGDVAAEFTIEHDRALWFIKTFFEGLRTTESHSGFVCLRGKSRSITLSCTNYRAPDYETMELPEPF